jgi:hypothetical protein
MPLNFLTAAQLVRYVRDADERSPSQLPRSFYLDDAARSLIAKRRGDHSGLGFALHICTARFWAPFSSLHSTAQYSVDLGHRRSRRPSHTQDRR